MPECDLYVNNVFWKKIERLNITHSIRMRVFDVDENYLDRVQYVSENRVHMAEFDIERIRQTILVHDDYHWIFYKGHCNDPCFFLGNNNELCYKKIGLPKVKKIFTRYELLDFDN